MIHTRPLQLRLDWQPADPEAIASERYTAALQREFDLEQALAAARVARMEASAVWRTLRYGGVR